MRTHVTAFLTAGLVAVVGATAHAGTLYTPPITPQTDEGIRCIIANVGKKPRRVDIAIVDPFAIDTHQPNFLTVQPGKVHAGSTSVGAQINGYCRFTVEGPKRDFRAAGCASNGLLRCTTGMVEAR